MNAPGKIPNEKGAPHVVIVPRWIMRERGMTAVAKLYLIWVLDQWRNSNEPLPRADKWVAKRIRMSVRAIRAARRELVDGKYLEVEETKPASARSSSGNLILCRPLPKAQRPLKKADDGVAGFIQASYDFGPLAAADLRPTCAGRETKGKNGRKGAQLTDRLVCLHLQDRSALAHKVARESGRKGDGWQALYCGIDDVCTGTGLGRKAAAASIDRLHQRGAITKGARGNSTSLLYVHAPHPAIFNFAQYADALAKEQGATVDDALELVVELRGEGVSLRRCADGGIEWDDAGPANASIKSRIESVGAWQVRIVVDADRERAEWVAGERARAAALFRTVQRSPGAASGRAVGLADAAPVPGKRQKRKAEAAPVPEEHAVDQAPAPAEGPPSSVERPTPAPVRQVEHELRMRVGHRIWGTIAAVAGEMDEGLIARVLAMREHDRALWEGELADFVVRAAEGDAAALARLARAESDDLRATG